MNLLQQLLDKAATLAGPHIGKEGFTAIPEEAKGEVVTAIFAGESEFIALVTGTEIGADDAAAKGFIEQARVWFAGQCDPAYGTSFPAAFEATLDKLVNGKFK